MTAQPPFTRDKPLKDVCTLAIGGPALYFTEISQIPDMQSLLTLCNREGLPYFILGKGSNTLFDDRGFSGLVIHNKIDFFRETSPGYFLVGAGYSFSLLGSKTAREGFSGLEFASGIPGSIGGAVFMNAGANGKETADSLAAVHFIDEEGNLHIWKKQELSFSYRSSSFQQLKGAIVAAEFALEPSEKAREQQLAIIRYRQATQPYKNKSAGCMFRNPINGSAGQLIESCGLKGYSVGGAQVSEIHANFIINQGGASSADVCQLIAYIKEEVKKKKGIDLQSEVQIVPAEGAFSHGI